MGSYRPRLQFNLHTGSRPEHLVNLAEDLGGYGTLSGTSMAAPYIAGCTALVMQAHPGIGTVEVMRLLTSTARPLKFNDGTNKTYNFLSPVDLQGNGVVDALGAVQAKTVFSRSHLPWNDTEFFTGNMSLYL